MPDAQEPPPGVRPSSPESNPSPYKWIDLHKLHKLHPDETGRIVRLFERMGCQKL